MAAHATGALADTSVVSMHGIWFSYDGTPILRGACLDLRGRGFVTIIGPNGGGKTTLLRLMLGLLKPSAGRVEIFGKPPHRARREIGYLPQHLLYDPQFPIRVLDVVLMGRLGQKGIGPYRGGDRRKAEQALARVGLGGLGSRAFQALSGGQRQRVLIARALACEPRLLLLDEPAASLDAGAEQSLYELLRELSREITVIAVSHDIGVVSSFIDTVVCVAGKVDVHPTGELTGDLIRELYGGDIRLVRHDHRCNFEGHECPSS